MPELYGSVFVLGKGGVGKSVIAAGLAALSDARGQPTLLVRLGESIGRSDDHSLSPVPSPHGFDSVDLDPRFAMDEYVQKVVRVRALSDRITGSDVYRKFFAAAPGLPEIVLLGRIQAFADEKDGRGEPRWPVIVVDCPSSGHGLLMLETPFAAFRAVSIGPFARLASRVIEWLKGDVRLALVAVPEEMAVVEAVEFADDLQERTGLSVAFAILNRMHRSRLSAEAKSALTETETVDGSHDRYLADAAQRAQRRARLEMFHERRLTKGLGLKPLIVGELEKRDPASMADAIIGEAE